MTVVFDVMTRPARSVLGEKCQDAEILPADGRCPAPGPLDLFRHFDDIDVGHLAVPDCLNDLPQRDDAEQLGIRDGVGQVDGLSDLVDLVLELGEIGSRDILDLVRRLRCDRAKLAGNSADHRARLGQPVPDLAADVLGLADRLRQFRIDAVLRRLEPAGDVVLDQLDLALGNVGKQTLDRRNDDRGGFDSGMENAGAEIGRLIPEFLILGEILPRLGLEIIERLLGILLDCLASLDEGAEGVSMMRLRAASSILPANAFVPSRRLLMICGSTSSIFVIFASSEIRRSTISTSRCTKLLVNVIALVSSVAPSSLSCFSFAR